MYKFVNLKVCLVIHQASTYKIITIIFSCLLDKLCLLNDKPEMKFS